MFLRRNTGHQTGKTAELKAEKYLKQQGLKFVQRNFHWRYGEIDLIMSEGDTLVFVEVRARKSKQFGGASASITLAKKQKIIKTAYHFLQLNNFYEKRPFRFDVISFEGSEAEIQWIKNAF